MSSQGFAVSVESPEPLGRSLPWAVLMVLVAVLTVIWWPGCKQYPEVTSRESLDLIKALYSACSARNPEWLNRVEQELAELAESGKVTKREQTAFQRVIATAWSGNWEEAQQASLRFAQDQLK